MGGPLWNSKGLKLLGRKNRGFLQPSKKNSKNNGVKNGSQLSFGFYAPSWGDLGEAPQNLGLGPWGGLSFTFYWGRYSGV